MLVPYISGLELQRYSGEGSSLLVWSMAVCDYYVFCLVLGNLVSLAHVVSTAKEKR